MTELKNAPHKSRTNADCNTIYTEKIITLRIENFQFRFLVMTQDYHYVIWRFEDENLLNILLILTTVNPSERFIQLSKNNYTERTNDELSLMIYIRCNV